MTNPHSEIVTSDAVELACVAEYYQCYPGETVTFYIRLTLKQTVEYDLAIKLWLSVGLSPCPDSCIGPTPDDDRARINFGTKALDGYRREGRHDVVVWRLAQSRLRLADGPLEFRASADVLPLSNKDKLFTVWAELFQSQIEAKTETLLQQSEIIMLKVLSKPQRLDLLPGIYHQPEHALMWRYLMVCDHFWCLYEEFLANQFAYFDSHLAPADFLRWLAAWVGLTWDDRLPKSVQQGVIPNLIPQMVGLYQKRGTRSGLKEFLQIWLDVHHRKDRDKFVRIEETVAGNFIIGDDIFLSDDLIIGNVANQICRFTVTIIWPPSCEKLPEDFIREIIEAWKPAHTTYELFVN